MSSTDQNKPSKKTCFNRLCRDIPRIWSNIVSVQHLIWPLLFVSLIGIVQQIWPYYLGGPWLVWIIVAILVVLYAQRWQARMEEKAKEEQKKEEAAKAKGDELIAEEERLRAAAKAEELAKKAAKEAEIKKKQAAATEAANAKLATNETIPTPVVANTTATTTVSAFPELDEFESSTAASKKKKAEAKNARKEKISKSIANVTSSVNTTVPSTSTKDEDDEDDDLFYMARFGQMDNGNQKKLLRTSQSSETETVSQMSKPKKHVEAPAQLVTDISNDPFADDSEEGWVHGK
jgi:type III secretory pathway component EscV